MPGMTTGDFAMGAGTLPAGLDFADEQQGDNRRYRHR